MLEGCVTITVVGRTLLRVLQRFIGFVDFLEFDFGALIVRVLVQIIFIASLRKALFSSFSSAVLATPRVS